MKRLATLLLAVVLGLGFSGSLSAAEVVEGYWKSIDEKGKITAYWKFWLEGSELKGTIVKVPNQADSTTCTACKNDSQKYYGKLIIGTVWLYGFKKDGDKWVKGKIVDSGTGDIYWGSVEPVDNGNAIKLRGSLDKWGLAGKTQKWQRSSEQEIKTVK